MDASKCIAFLATSEDAQAELGLENADLSGLASQLGRAYHRLVELSAKTGIATEDVVLVATAYGVRFQHLWHLWSRVDVDHREGEPDEIIVEKGFSMKFGKITLTGTPDRVRRFDSTLEVEDWKTGRLIASGIDAEAETHGQLQAYMVLVLQQDWDVPIRRVIGRLYSIRNREVTQFEITENRFEQLTKHVGDLVTRAHEQRSLALSDREYTVDDHCRYCNGRAICPAYRERVNSDLAPFVSGEVEVISLARHLIRTDPGRAWFLHTIGSRISDAIKDAFRSQVEWEGPVSLSDEHEVRFASYEQQAKLSDDGIREALATAKVDATQAALVMDYIDLGRSAQRYPVNRLSKCKKKPK